MTPSDLPEVGECHRLGCGRKFYSKDSNTSGLCPDCEKELAHLMERENHRDRIEGGY